MRAHLFLVVLLMFTIVFDLLLDFLSDVLILLDFLGASIPQIVDLLRHLSHPLLEVFGQVGAQLPLLVEHRLVLQIQVVVLLEDGGAEEFESFPLLYRALKFSIELFSNGQLLLSCPIHHHELLHRFLGGVFHHLSDLIGKCLETLGVRAEAWTAIIQIIPLIEVFAHLLVELLLLFFFEF